MTTHPLDAIRNTLGTLITWMGQSANSPITHFEVKALLEMLNAEPVTFAKPEAESAAKVEILAQALAELLRVIELDDVPGYLGDVSGWECGECAPMDGSGRRPAIAEVPHEPDCFQGAIEQARKALHGIPYEPIKEPTR